MAFPSSSSTYPHLHLNIGVYRSYLPAPHEKIKKIEVKQFYLARDSSVAINICVNQPINNSLYGYKYVCDINTSS